MPDIHLLPVDAILDTALARDRAALDPTALGELRDSILRHGLRMPIEVFELDRPDGAYHYGLISGFRRLTTVRALRDLGLTAHATIPAFVREPASIAEALTAMVEENAIRAEISPWEQALIAVTARDRGLFDTIEAAIDALYVNLSRDRSRRLRAVAHLAEELDGALTAPETLSLRQLLRLAAAASRGYGELMRHALTESHLREPDAQWRLLQPILLECETPDIPDPRPGLNTRPRRLYTAPRHSLRIRREKTPTGWCLHFTGRDAEGDLIDRVFDEIDRMLSPS